MDTYFFDYKEAYQEARKQNKFTIFNNLQICYYNGKHKQSPYENLIGLPLDELCDYLSETPNRGISNIKFTEQFTKEQQHEMTRYINALQNIAFQKKSRIGDEYRKLIQNQEPNFNESWRILFITTRMTTVLQFATRNVEKVFRKMGYETFISIESNAMQSWGANDSHNNANFAWHLRNILEFNPHIIFNIDWVTNEFLNDKIFNFIWFQDPMPILFNDEEIKKRDRDYYFYILKSVGKMIEKKGIPESRVMLQNLCTNEEIFHNHYNIIRENKIVFLGGDYKFENKNDDIESKIVPLLCEMIDKGSLSIRKLEEIAEMFNYNYEYLNQYLLGSVARREIVKWICMQTKCKVEIYGPQEWLETKEIAPFYKGLLPYGEEMAKVYNSAKYALVAHHKYFYQQRLFEISACGAIPIVYDSGIAEDDFVHYDNVLTFRTFEELENSFTKKPKKDPKQISEDISFEHFAERIINIVEKKIKNNVK